jgi:hypothetical protein
VTRPTYRHFEEWRTAVIEHLCTTHGIPRHKGAQFVTEDYAAPSYEMGLDPIRFADEEAASLQAGARRAEASQESQPTSELDAVIAEIEAAGFNWETSKKGKNPDGTWQRFAEVWHPYTLSRPGWAMSSESNAAALREAFEAAQPPKKGR